MISLKNTLRKVPKKWFDSEYNTIQLFSYNKYLNGIDQRTKGCSKGNFIRKGCNESAQSKDQSLDIWGS